MIKINWFIDGEHVFDTTGALPYVGDVVCLTDKRDGLSEKRYIVKDARHRVVLTREATNKDQLVYKVEVDKIELSEQFGEVFLEEMDTKNYTKAKLKVI